MGDGVLVWYDGSGMLATGVETPAQYARLVTERVSLLAGQNGSLTAPKERYRRGWYWKAYRSRAGRLHKAYLGKAEVLSLNQFNAAARQLSRLTGSHRPLHEASAPITPVGFA